MNVKNLIDALELEVICGGEFAEKRQISGGYCGDLLSWVMSKAKEGDCWLTVMGNVNSVGVAVLADVACILLTENAAFDEDALARAKQNSVIVLRSSKDAFTLAAEIAKML